MIIPSTFTSALTQRMLQRGLSLIELLVGLAIGLFLTLGLFTLIVNTSQTFRVQDDFARMQENATAALHYLGDSIRMAGFYGYAMDPSLISNNGVATTTDCGSAANPPTSNWALNVITPLQGFTGLTPLTVHDVLPCILASNFVTGPVLVTRAAAGYRIPDPNNDGNLTDGIAAQTDYNTTIYMQADPNVGLIFYGADYSDLRDAGTTRSTSTGADVDVFEYGAYVYYIRPCSRPNGGGIACTGAADDSGRPIPTLVRQELVGSAMTEVPLVEGIDLMDLRFGLDNNNDGVPDMFTATPASTDWVNVVAVKVSLLVRSPGMSNRYDDSAKTYDLDGDGNPDYRCIDHTGTDPNVCHYKRKVFSQTFQVRNTAQRRGA